MDIKSYKQALKNQISELDSSENASGAEANAEYSDEGFADAVAGYLSTIKDKNQSVGTRLEAMKALKAAEFLGPQFDPHLDDYHTTLRDVSEDKSSTIREYAIGTLAVAKDSYILKKLLDGLKEKIEPLISEDKAIMHLANDEHSGAAKVVRERFDKLGDRAKESALRLLSKDKKSESILEKLMSDTDAKSSLRCISAAGLKNLNPGKFKKAAERIISNDTDFDEIKALCVSALTNNIKGGGDLIDDGIIQKVKDIRTRSRNLRSAIKRFVDRS